MTAEESKPMALDDHEPITSDEVWVEAVSRFHNGDMAARCRETGKLVMTWQGRTWHVTALGDHSYQWEEL